MSDLTPPSATLNSQLRLIKFVWDKGNQRDTIEFLPGFNLIGQRSQAERAIFLRLIRYAMGGSESRIDTEIMRATKGVLLEFLVNGKHVVTQRGFEHPDGRFQVDVDGQSHSRSPREMGEFLLDLLDIPKVRYERGDSKPLLSFNDLARAFVVDRDFGYTEMLAKMSPEPRKETVKLLLGFTTQEIANAEEETRKIERNIQRLKDEIRGIERLLSNFQVGSLIEIEQRRANLRAVLEQAEQDERTLRARIQQTASQQSPIEDSPSEAYQSLRSELIERRNRLGEIDAELAILSKQVKEKTDLRALLEGEADKLERHSSSRYVLSTFTFSRCPRCLQPIDADMRAREQDHECMLCGRSFQPTTMNDDGAWSKALADAKRIVLEVDELLANYKMRSNILEKEQGEIRPRIEWLQLELDRQTVQYVSPFIEELSLVNERRAQLLQALSELDLEEKQRRYALQVSDEELPALRRNLEQAEESLQKLKLRRGRLMTRIEAFLDHFRYFMQKTASSQYRNASWDETEFLPQINDQEHTRAMTAFDLAISVLAFHYALLALRVKPPQFDTAHPRLLIVDEPEQQKMEPRQYQQIMQLLVDLANTYSNEVQILVAATSTVGFTDYIRPIVVEQG